MCLITTQTEPLIAKEDIITYKTLLNGLTSRYYKSYQYKIGELNQIDIKESNGWVAFNREDMKWINQYIDYDNASKPLIASGIDDGEVFNILCKDKKLKCFGQGFHSNLNKEKLMQSFRDIVYVECTIPKDSMYYKNPIGLVVSNKLIVNRIIKIEKI